MRKKTLFKLTALFICIGFLSLTVPGFAAVDKKAPRSSAKAFLKSPIEVATSFFDFVRDFFRPDKKVDSKNENQKNNTPIARPTGELDSDKPSGGD